MKTSFTHIDTERPSQTGNFKVVGPVCIRTENGDLKSRLLRTLARENVISELPERLFDEICEANEAADGRYEKLIDDLMGTNAYRQASWSDWVHTPHFGLMGLRPARRQ